MKKIDIVQAMYDAVLRQIDIVAALNFQELISKSHVATELMSSTISDADQIHLINIFWREQLADVPNTTDIRAWLCEGDDVEAYVGAFERNWVHAVHNAGII